MPIIQRVCLINVHFLLFDFILLYFVIYHVNIQGSKSFYQSQCGYCRCKTMGSASLLRAWTYISRRAWYSAAE